MQEGVSPEVKEQLQQVVDLMQTREALYDFLDYHQYERKLDALFSPEQQSIKE